MMLKDLLKNKGTRKRVKKPAIAHDPQYARTPIDITKLTPCEKTQLLQDHELDIFELRKQIVQLKKELQELKE